MINDDEREAREWLKRKVDYGVGANYARTILALLDRPTLPRPEDLSDEALNAMLGKWFYSPDQDGNEGGMRAAYRALYDHYMQPPASPAIWSVFTKGNMLVGFFVNEDEATECAHRCAGRRVVKYVEDRDGR